MNKLLKKYIRPIIRMCGVDFVHYKKNSNIPPDFDELDIQDIKNIPNVYVIGLK